MKSRRKKLYAVANDKGSFYETFGSREGASNFAAKMSARYEDRVYDVSEIFFQCRDGACMDLDSYAKPSMNLEGFKTKKRKCKNGRTKAGKCRKAKR